MNKSNQAGTHYWVKQLSKVQLPALSGVMQELNAVTQNDDSCASQLAEIILKDSALTTKVLRIANSAYHNPRSDNAITTISRAVVQLGFQGIKAICLSVMMVDSLLKDNPKQRLLEWMARGFHCAVQAENLLKQVNGNEKEEEVFITALLLHVGEMAFWSGNTEASQRLDEKLEPGSTGNSQLEQDLLGSRMCDISKALAQEWQLDYRLQEALSPSKHPSLAIQAVLLGEEISFATEKGWDSKEFRDVLVKASIFSGLSLEDVRLLIEKGAEKAAAVAVNYGANKICHLIPNARPESSLAPSKALKPNPQLQLDILREMGAMVEQMVDINTLFQVVVEGIHRGIALERVCLCLVDPKVTAMKAKYVLGDDVDGWRKNLNMPIKSEQDNLFARCLHTHKSIWLRPATRPSFQHLIDKKTEKLIDTGNCLISAVYAGSRPIGVIIADRGRSNPLPIDEAQYDSFAHFSQQTTMSLSMLAEKTRQLRKAGQ